MIAQFSGESRREAIVNHFSLDIEEEEDFFDYMEFLGIDENASDEVIESTMQLWREYGES